MNSLDPVQFTRTYLKELEASGTGSSQPAAASSSPDEVTLYDPGSKEISSKPPTLADFTCNIQKLQARKADERTISQYCGLSLLLSYAAAMSTGAAATAGPLYIGMAGAVGKMLTSPEVEQEYGRKAAAELIRRSGISSDPALNERFTKTAVALLEHSPLHDKNYRLVVLNTDEVNASSAPGALFVTKGIMDRFPDDGELALFIGHEIAHAEDRDSMEGAGKGMFEQLTFSNTLMKSKVKVNGTDKNIGDYRKSLKESFYDSSLTFERSNETSADRRGTELLLKAGFSPEGAKSAIEKICALEEENRLKGIKDQVYQKLGYYDEAEIAKRLAEQKRLDYHPPVAERLRAVQQAIEGGQGQGGSSL